jgi:uncharacterized protein involved in exopolysaccharide biosynthesis/Mrp family chromosome partitioning ATPase
MPKESPQEQPGLSLGLADIQFILIRRKWLILAFALVGIIAAGALYITKQKMYRSTAKLVIRFIQEKRDVTAGDDTQFRSPDTRGDTIVNTELEILTSWNLSQAVAQTIGPSNILSAYNSASTNIEDAALVIRKSIIPEVPRKSATITISFDHPDPKVARDTLTAILSEYRRRHVEIHRGSSVVDFLTKETDRLRVELDSIDNELRGIRTNYGIISLDDTKKSMAQQLTQLRQTMYDLEAQLRVRQELAGGLNATNTSATNTTFTQTLIPTEERETYLRLISRLNNLRKEEDNLLGRFTELHPSVTSVRDQIQKILAEKTGLEEKNSNLVTLASLLTTTGSGQTNQFTDPSQAALLDARLKALQLQMVEILKDAAELDQAERLIIALQQKKELEDGKFRQYRTSLEQARIDDEIRKTGTISNIPIAQEPSPAAPAVSEIRKTALAVAGGGLGLGLALAFLLELFLHPTVKRSLDIPKKLGLALFLSIPLTRGTWKTERGKRKRQTSGGGPLVATAPIGGDGRTPVRPDAHTDPVKSEVRSQKSETSSAAIGPRSSAFGDSRSNGLAPWDEDHELREYYEALRDRLILYFEAHGLHHKPKLIGITACNHGAGTSTLAAGLAAVLSETGEGNVLLVDMNQNRGAAHPFFQGKPSLGLFETMSPEKRSAGQLQDNLFMASVNQMNGGSHPIRNSKYLDFMPKLRKSDFDYIVFDLPPVAQTSLAVRLAGFMDKMFVVVEAEKTSVEGAKKALAHLSDSKAPVSGILNKTKTYAPTWLMEV